MDCTQDRGGVRLRRMTASEFPDFRRWFIADWAIDLARVDDLSPEQAVREATSRTDADLTQGVDTPGHLLFVILDGEARVGTLWCSVDAERHVFLDDLTIEEGARGKGYGSRALQLLEVEARDLGATRVDLHVYAHNPAAIALYQKLGYTTTGLKMRKPLTR